MDQTIADIREASRQMVRELHLLDGRHCISGFTFSECHLLTELESFGQATAKQLAERLVLEKSTVSRLVTDLVDRRLVQASRDPADGRRRQLALTDKGHEAVQGIHGHAIGQVRGALDYVPPEEARAIVDGLSRYARALKYARLSEAFRVRPIEPADNRAVARIIRQVMTEFGAVGEEYSISDPEVDAMYEAYQGPKDRFYVVQRKARILGCGGVAALKGGDEDTCELQKMYFLPELRGTGMGARLLNRLLHDARQLGYRRCYLETLDRMEAARRLYARNGFESIDSPMGCTGHSGCNSWMLKQLDR